MNERIRELVKRAERFADVFCEDIDDDDLNHWNDAFNDKFAELIVRECAEIAEQCVERQLDWPGDKIREHFGVK